MDAGQCEIDASCRMLLSQVIAIFGNLSRRQLRNRAVGSRTEPIQEFPDDAGVTDRGFWFGSEFLGFNPSSEKIADGIARKLLAIGYLVNFANNLTCLSSGQFAESGRAGGELVTIGNFLRPAPLNFFCGTLALFAIGTDKASEPLGTPWESS